MVQAACTYVPSHKTSSCLCHTISTRQCVSFAHAIVPVCRFVYVSELEAVAAALIEQQHATPVETANPADADENPGLLH